MKITLITGAANEIEFALLRELFPSLTAEDIPDEAFAELRRQFEQQEMEA